MKDNYLAQALYWITYSIISLFILSLIPQFSVGNFTYKRINLIADLEPEPAKPKADTLISSVPSKDTTNITAVEPAVEKITSDCPPGIFCFEDYSDEHNALAVFINSIKTTKSKPVRIAFYGDSFIEGDILTSSLRDTLQRVLGGRGVGYVPITSEVAKFRTTIKHSFENWTTYSIIGTYEEEPTFGVGGFCAEPLEGNMVEYSPGHGASLNKLSIFYTSTSNRTLHYTVRDSIAIDTVLKPNPNLSVIDLNNLRSKAIKISIDKPDSIQLYGVALEDNAGIYVDNLAMRGNSGIGLSRISSSMLRQTNKIRPYKLVILQFGLNAVGENDSTQYIGYTQSMTRVVNKFKEAFTDCSFLIVSVSDRSSNQNGNFKTIPGILAMREAQRQIAKNTGIAFWDLFAAMGGENSMPKFVNAKPSMAGKDYTHLNFRGGRFMAKRLADALFHERERYEKAQDTF